jgi:uncharacterized protein YuzE|tara:strand:- start:3229 stop:3630 length:402 start_codon:yes stop_codon:yes gene_type:complete
MQDNVKYFKEEDRFYVLVDYPYDGARINTVEVVKDYVSLDLDMNSGGIYLVEIYKVADLLEASFSDEKIKYSGDTDSLSISLTPNDDTEGPCDLVFRTEDEVMISLNRTEVGNLTGIEIVGFQFAINHKDFIV